MARFYAALAIYSDTASPEQISSRLGVEPDSTIGKGSATGASRVAPQHGWFVTTKGRDVEGDCDEHICWLLSRVPGLSALDGGDHERWLWVFWEASETGGGPTFSSSTMRALAEIDACLVIDMYRTDGVPTWRRTRQAKPNPRRRGASKKRRGHRKA